MAKTIIVEEVKKIVQNVSDVLTPKFKNLDQYIEAVHYLHGHPLEVAQTLSERTKAGFSFKKYPLIALLQDFPERHGIKEGFEMEVNLHLLICKSTQPTYKAEKRYEVNFKPFLYPIYDELLNQIHKSKVFVTDSVETISHTKIDRLYWGTEGAMSNKANIFLDHLDIIEVKELKLFIKKNYC